MNASDTDPTRYSRDTDVRRTGWPRWLSVLAISVAVLVVLAIVVLHLTGVIGPSSH